MGIQDPRKRRHGGGGGDSPSSSRKRPRRVTRNGLLYLRSLGPPMISPGVDFARNSICLRSDQLFTFGRKTPFSQIVLRDRFVSKKHCQVFFDSSDRKIYIVDGFVSDCDLDETRKWFRRGLDRNEMVEGFSVRPSLNGVFVNGAKIKRGSVVELFVGDEVSFACANDLSDRVGFVVQRTDYMEEIADVANVFDLKADRICKDVSLCRSGHEETVFRASFLLNKCREILQSLDPVFYIRKCVDLDQKREIALCKSGFPVIRQKDHFQKSRLCKVTDTSSSGQWTKNVICGLNAVDRSGDVFTTDSTMLQPDKVMTSQTCSRIIVEPAIPKQIQSLCFSQGPLVEANAAGDNKMKEIIESVDQPLRPVENPCQNNHDSHCMKNKEVCYSSPGKSFFLNRLRFMECGSYDQHAVVSLPELFHPVESLRRVFVATFTSDVLCYPIFPEVIAFGKDRLKKGVACHHPKLLVLQREDSIRVVVTSANLVPNQNYEAYEDLVGFINVITESNTSNTALRLIRGSQGIDVWNNVTNTVWWQDFPRRTNPDYLSLFDHISYGETSEEIKSDFAAQLAGFMASLVSDVPAQAHWIAELTKYDFSRAVGHLVASIPGIHTSNPPYPPESMHLLSVSNPSRSIMVIGAIILLMNEGPFICA
ncbi:hypothetical protein ACLOJK_038085 [Asimina triloba]